MAKAKRLPSGNWRVRVWRTVDGKQQSKSITAPTRAEAEHLAKEFVEGIDTYTPDTVRTVIEKYINLSEILSPTTLAAYDKILQYAFPTIMDKVVGNLSDSDMQQAINIECKRKVVRTGKQISPKTVKNEWGLVAASLKTICNKTYNVRLPKTQHKNQDLPEPKEIMDIIKGTEIELPCLLAMWCSLRMSEVRGLMCSSLKGGMISIDSIIVDVDGLQIRKELAKTDASIRRVPVPQYILSIIKETDSYKEYKRTGIDRPLVDMTRNQIHHSFSRLMKKNGIEMTFHDLRHLYASISLNILQIPEKIVQDEGGWATASVMKKVYSQGFSSAKASAQNKRNEYLDSLVREQHHHAPPQRPPRQPEKVEK